MPQVVIENPILNSPYEEPTRHWKFGEEGITNEVVEERRPSSYFKPVPAAKRKGGQLPFETEWTKDRIEESKHINRIREKVSIWRRGGYRGTTRTTERLLRYWTDPERERKLFFCQIEALETAIYITEVATKSGDTWIENELRAGNERANPDLFRIAFKMATGSGKTVVMAMLIAWHALNKLANPQDARFGDSFLIVTPGLTIRDRLRVLLPNDPNNYYRERDLVSAEDLVELGKAKIVITNFHGFKLRERGEGSRLTKEILRQKETGAFRESPDEMVRRVCRELGSKKNIVVINDEAHHCYRRKPDGEEVKLVGDERKEAERRDEEARIWISGLEAVKKKIGLRALYDLSATPFFLRGSGYPEGTLFPWVVSDFSLIDAIEAGIVKIPRVPVADDSMTGDQPTYRELWTRIRTDLPKKGRKGEELGVPKVPVELEGALRSLYGHYQKHHEMWLKDPKGLTPPVFIVVCNNTSVSKLVFDYVAGYEKTLTDGTTVLVPGELPIFGNVQNGTWTPRPSTILVDSQQLESGEGMSTDFKKIAAIEIEEFKDEYRTRFPGRDPEELTDEDLLREVMNTVGKPGKLGEHIKCVVSVSMLTEGWDANTVTHILGVRAFQTQLLCEQVIGRGLRRISYIPNEEGRFDPEYAEIYGVPFSFIPCAGATATPRVGKIPVRVRALEDRIASEITFPRVVSYRYELPAERLSASFTADSKLALSTQDLPTKTELAGIVGESEVHTLDDLRAKREQEIAFRLAKLLMQKYFSDGDAGNAKPWLFPHVLSITRRWLEECVVLKDGTFKQLLLLVELAHDACDRIYRAIVSSAEGEKRLLPVLRPYDPIGSTRYVDFDTTRPVYETDSTKCQVSHVVGDSSWEHKMAQALEEMPEVLSYVKNQGLTFTMPYTVEGEEHSYIPDFIVRLDDGRGHEDPLNLVIEVSGQTRKAKVAKAQTARALWIPAVNTHGGFGRWDFIEITDPWDAQNTIRALLTTTRTPSATP
jgi:type III restriction enzyme